MFLILAAGSVWNWKHLFGNTSKTEAADTSILPVRERRKQGQHCSDTEEEREACAGFFAGPKVAACVCFPHGPKLGRVDRTSAGLLQEEKGAIGSEGKGCEPGWFCWLGRKQRQRGTKKENVFVLIQSQQTRNKQIKYFGTHFNEIGKQSNYF